MPNRSTLENKYVYVGTCAPSRNDDAASISMLELIAAVAAWQQVHDVEDILLYYILEQRHHGFEISFFVKRLVKLSPPL